MRRTSEQSLASSQRLLQPLRRVVRLLADDDREGRKAVKDVVLGLLHRPSGRGRLARAIADAAEQLAPRRAEAEALRRACGEHGTEG